MTANDEWRSPAECARENRRWAILFLRGAKIENSLMYAHSQKAPKP
jgi:hypothetical protein